MAKFNRVTKLIAQDGVTRLRIYAHSGKNGFNLGATLRQPGQKAQTGAQATLDTEEKAVETFNKMVKDATDRGWTIRATNSGIGNRSRFTEIPMAPKAKEETPEPAKNEEPAEPVAAGSLKKNGKK